VTVIIALCDLNRSQSEVSCVFICTASQPSARGNAMGIEYEVFVTLPGDDPVEIGSVSGWESLQRTLAYYVKLSPGEIVAVDKRTGQVIIGVNATETEFPAKRAKATAA
jgi:hypothetical protein